MLETAAQTITRTIAGREVCLPPGRYMASRPMANKGRRTFPVSLHALDADGYMLHAGPVLVLEGFDYDAANAFLTEFNTEETPSTGRQW